MVILLLCSFLLVVYTLWDNNRINVVEQVIEIENLPQSLEGFTILQVTDLHEKVFGPKQSKLINIVNNIEYDVIAFTGDMLINNTSQNYEPYFSLLDGINNKEHALFVPGNADPSPYRVVNSQLATHEFIKGMEDKGVKFLKSNYAIHIKNYVIRLVDFESTIISEKRIDAYKDGSNSPFVRLQMQKYEENKVIDNEETDLLIAINHYPVPDQKIDMLNEDSFYNLRDFDLVVAGHYHGGQFRIPFLGAIFVPEPFYKRNGLFPPQNRVKGLWEYKGIKQYVSTGLGSSDTIPFMKFRLFNTPEVNVLVFTKKQ